MKLVAALLVSSAVVFAAGCAPRGTLSYGPPTAGASEQTVMVATSRARGDRATGFTGNPADTLSYERHVVSIPPNHEPGQIEWAGSQTPDPARHFVTTDSETLSSRDSFRRAVSRELRKLPPGQRRLVLFTHGYNSNFAESLYRVAQINKDISGENLPILFTWPSAGKGTGYLHDRDRVLASRSDYADMMELAIDVGADELLISAHSLGSFLTLEALEELVERRGEGVVSKISGLAFLSPDIAVDVFLEQAERIGTLPQPFVVFSSQEDRALKLSARISGEPDRLGSLKSTREISGVPVTVVDTTAFADPGAFNHLTAVTSPEVLAFIREVQVAGAGLDEDIRSGTNLVAAQVDSFQQTTSVILQPR